MGIKTVPQPPYRPDFAPCDFWLFFMLTGCRYETIEEDERGCDESLDMLTQENVHGAFDKLLERYKQMHYSRRRNTSKGPRVSCVYYQ